MRLRVRGNGRVSMSRTGPCGHMSLPTRCHCFCSRITSASPLAIACMPLHIVTRHLLVHILHIVTRHLLVHLLHIVTRQLLVHILHIVTRHLHVHLLHIVTRQLLVYILHIVTRHLLVHILSSSQFTSGVFKQPWSGLHVSVVHTADARANPHCWAGITINEQTRATGYAGCHSPTPPFLSALTAATSPWEPLKHQLPCIQSPTPPRTVSIVAIDGRIDALVVRFGPARHGVALVRGAIAAVHIICRGIEKPWVPIPCHLATVSHLSEPLQDRLIRGHWLQARWTSSYSCTSTGCGQ
jgi:hypothetical protein